MALGVYMDNLSNREDTGEEISVLLGSDPFKPDFKNRHTIQVWKCSFNHITVDPWAGSTLADDSAHEIYINNPMTATVDIKFNDRYVLLDEDHKDTVFLKTGEVAHFYCSPIYTESQQQILILRTGTQDSRK